MVKKLTRIMMTLLLVLGLGLFTQVNAAELKFDYENGQLVGDEFTFDILVADIDPLANLDLFQIDFRVYRDDGGIMAPFTFDVDMGIGADPNYVFYNDSFAYSAFVTPPPPGPAQEFEASVADLTNSGNGVTDAVGKTLARITLDHVQYCDWFIFEVFDSSVFSDNAQNDIFLAGGNYQVHVGPVVPIPGAFMLMASGLLGLVGFSRRKE
jgi:hypothetical protein